MVRVPFSPPRWFSARTIATVAAAAFGAVTALPATMSIQHVESLLRRHPLNQGILVATTALLSGFLARRILSARSLGGARVVAILGGGALGAFNMASSFALINLVERWSVAEMVRSFVLGGLFSPFFGLPLGLAYGVVFALGLGAIFSHANAESHEGVDRSALIGCALVGFGGLVAFALVEESHAHSAFALAVWPAWLALVSSTLGFSACALRMWGRRRFVAALRGAGAPWSTQDGFALEPALPEHVELPSLFPSSQGELVLAFARNRAEVYRSRAASALPLARL